MPGGSVAVPGVSSPRTSSPGLRLGERCGFSTGGLSPRGQDIFGKAAAQAGKGGRRPGSPLPDLRGGNTLKERRRRRIPADKVREAARGFYSRLAAPETFTCSRCHEERNSVGQEDGICLRCRWEMRAEARGGCRP
jgi:DnaJ-class molecular chaperone